MPENIRGVIGAGEYNNNPGWLLTQEEDLNLLNYLMWEKQFKAESVVNSVSLILDAIKK